MNQKDRSITKGLSLLPRNTNNVNKSTSSLFQATKENINPNLTKKTSSILLEVGPQQLSGVVKKPTFAKVVDINCSYLDRL